MRQQVKIPKLPLIFLLALVFLLPSHSGFAKKTRRIPFKLKQEGPYQKVPPSELNVRVETSIIDLTNQLRYSKKRVQLKPNALLKKVALIHSKDMKEQKYLSHYSPEGKSVLDRLQKELGRVQTHLGENIHTIKSRKGLYDAKAIANLMMKDWMSSKSHRKNILSKQFTQIGVACVSDGHEIFCTQVFSGANL